MQSVTINGLDEISKLLEVAPEVVRDAKAEFFEEAGRTLLEDVQHRIGGRGNVAGAQKYYVGSGRGYVAVRAAARNEQGGYLISGNEMYPAGYITNALEGGHAQTAGRYVPAIGARLKADHVMGKYMYQAVGGHEMQRVAEEGAEIIENKVRAHIEGESHKHPKNYSAIEWDAVQRARKKQIAANAAGKKIWEMHE